MKNGSHTTIVYKKDQFHINFIYCTFKNNLAYYSFQKLNKILPECEIDSIRLCLVLYLIF